MKFSRKVCLMIILKVSKNEGFIFSLEDTFFEKPQGGVCQNDPPPAVIGLKHCQVCFRKSFGKIK